MSGNMRPVTVQEFLNCTNANNPKIKSDYLFWDAAASDAND
jgi:hypothetical protein